MFGKKERVVYYGMLEHEGVVHSFSSTGPVRESDERMVATGSITYTRGLFRGWRVEGKAQIEMVEGCARWDPYILQARAAEEFKPGRKR